MSSPSGWIPKNEDGDYISEQATFPVPNEPVAHTGAWETFASTFHIDDNAVDPEEDAGPARAPEHIPRPPNGFILFRRQFSKDHAKPGPRTRRNKNSPRAPGILSKQAGEMWRSLPDTEKAYWMQRQEEAKEEHALRNPNYIFRPQRHRSKSEKRSRRSRSSRGAKQNRRAAVSALDLTQSRSGTATPVPPSPTDTISPRAEEQYSRKAMHRRSLSVPIIPSAQLFAFEENISQPTDRSLKRRSRSFTSMTGNREYLSQYPFATTFSSDFMSYQETGFTAEQYDNGSNSFDRPEGSLGSTLYQVSPLAAIASNQTGWDSGRNDFPVRPRPVNSQTWPQTSNFSAPNPDSFYYTPYMPPPMVQPEDVQYAPWEPAQFFGSHDSYGQPVFPDENTGAPHYDVGLTEQVIGRPPPDAFLPFGLYQDTHPSSGA